MCVTTSTRSIEKSMATDNSRYQDLLSRNGALATALEECLRRLATLYGDDAYQELKSLRDELIRKFKNAGIPANREMEHAEVVRPAIEVLETVFDDVLSTLA
jgi:chaperonin GroEL (HSP60 family)